MNDLAIPERMKGLPRDKHGRVVPWFVANIDGEWDFRVIRSGGLGEAVNLKLCWVCGQPRGSYAAFVIGPMCAVNRTSSEPPAHRDCALYSAQVCPFLTTPNMKRRDRHLPEDMVDPAGISILRNPGVALVWVTKKWWIRPDPDGRPLFDIGEPDQTYWFAHGREATRAEVEASIESGLPILREYAAVDGARGLRELDAQVARARKVIPAT
jgi:hypothetical protein